MARIRASNIVDLYSPTANMYGCEPCPKCGSKYRCRFNDKPDLIQCSCCHFTEMTARDVQTEGEEN